MHAELKAFHGLTSRECISACGKNQMIEPVQSISLGSSRLANNGKRRRKLAHIFHSSERLCGGDEVDKLDLPKLDRNRGTTAARDNEGKKKEEQLS